MALAGGWSALDAFSCDRDAPDARMDGMGLVMLLRRRPILELDAKSAKIAIPGGRHQTYRRKSGLLNACYLWDLLP